MSDNKYEQDENIIDTTMREISVDEDSGNQKSGGERYGWNHEPSSSGE